MLANAVFQVIERNRKQEKAVNERPEDDGPEDDGNPSINNNDVKAARKNLTPPPPTPHGYPHGYRINDEPKHVTMTDAAFSHSSSPPNRNSSAQSTRVSRRKSTIAKVWTKKKALKLYLLTNPFPVFLVIIACWMVSGALIFQHFILDVTRHPEDSKITFVEGLYFTVQAGLGVGFGLLFMLSTPWRLYAIFHSMVGATVILAALGLWVRTAEHLSLIRARKAEEERLEDEERERRMSVKPKLSKKLERWVLRNWDIVFAVVWYFAWLWIGVLFSCLYWGFTIVDGLTFAFFAMSTAGLEPPGDTRTVGLLFTTAFIIVGVPSFAVVCGHIIKYFQDLYTKNKQRSQRLLEERAICQQRRDDFAKMKSTSPEFSTARLSLQDMIQEAGGYSDSDDNDSDNSDGDESINTKP